MQSLSNAISYFYFLAFSTVIGLFAWFGPSLGTPLFRSGPDLRTLPVVLILYFFIFLILMVCGIFGGATSYRMVMWKFLPWLLLLGVIFINMKFGGDVKGEDYSFFVLFLMGPFVVLQFIISIIVTKIKLKTSH